ncbi:hypothetical protein [Nostoc sp. UHCC 0252]|uniref:hypothetical protein n=1 Tax=Nostoc sp. UHCC 0252 TaxID=3110241 RepID=UPI002B21CF4D|nr:hypothetical protein [Nostoc sp. UHCC 0252]MEA5603813.1 hypothetical protein [Nostoc sp. UHCC 0252]
MDIYASKGWQDTGYKPGLQKNAGSWVIVRAEGEWNVNTKDPAFGRRDANGRTPNSGATYMLSTENDKNINWPYTGPRGFCGQLIGKLGSNGEPFVVGDWCKISTSLADPSDSLWLAPNDANCTDNEGSLQVTFKVSNLEDRNIAQEKESRIASYEKWSGKTYNPG